MQILPKKIQTRITEQQTILILWIFRLSKNLISSTGLFCNYLEGKVVLYSSKRIKTICIFVIFIFENGFGVV